MSAAPEPAAEPAVESAMPSRTVVVTGASRGVGRALVGHLLEAGHTVVATARDPQRADLSGNERLHHERLHVVALDTTDAASIDAAATRIAAAVSHIDVLVNNAGIKSVPGYEWEASAGPLPQLEPEAVSAVFATNVIGPLMVTRGLLPLLGEGSVVINVSSLLGSLADGLGIDYAYNASKSALNMVTVTMQRDLGDLGITAVALNPGWIRTEMGGEEAPFDLTDATADIAALIGRVDATFAGRYVDRFGEPMRW